MTKPLKIAHPKSHETVHGPRFVAFGRPGDETRDIAAELRQGNVKKADATVTWQPSGHHPLWVVDFLQGVDEGTYDLVILAAGTTTELARSKGVKVKISRGISVTYPSSPDYLQVCTDFVAYGVTTDVTDAIAGAVYQASTGNLVQNGTVLNRPSQWNNGAWSMHFGTLAEDTYRLDVTQATQATQSVSGVQAKAANC